MIMTEDSKVNRWFFLFLYSCLTLSSLLFTACGQEDKPQQTPPSVVVAPAVVMDLVASGEIIGQTKAYNDVELKARVQGFLTKRLFTEGQSVKKDDLLFEIEDSKYNADLEAANASLLKANAQFKNASIDYERNSLLVSKNAISKRDFDNSEYIYMGAKAAVMNAQSQVDNAKLNLSYTKIRAPFDGKIGTVAYSVGNLVGNNDTKLANIVSTDPMRVMFNISELELLNYEVNNQTFEERTSKLIVRIQFQNGQIYPHEGKLYFADNKINSSTGTILIEALFPNLENILIPGMYLKVLLQKRDLVSGIVIPQQAILKSQIGSSVLVVSKDGIVSQRLVKTGIINSPNIQVKEGLTEGEYVIIEGLQIVRPGLKVEYTVNKGYASILSKVDNFHSIADTMKNPDSK